MAKRMNKKCSHFPYILTLILLCIVGSVITLIWKQRFVWPLSTQNTPTIVSTTDRSRDTTDIDIKIFTNYNSNIDHKSIYTQSTEHTTHHNINIQQIQSQVLASQTSNYVDFLSWLKNNGAKGTENIEIKQFSSGFRTVFSKTRMIANDTVMFIPRNLLITREYAITHINSKLYFNTSFYKIKQDFHRKRSIFGIYLVQEYFKFEKSFWYQFLRILPSNYNQFMPIYLYYNNDSRIINGLKGTTIIVEIAEWFDKYNHDYQIFSQYLLYNTMKVNGNGNGNMNTIFTMDNFLWGVLAVQSRLWSMHTECNSKYYSK